MKEECGYIYNAGVESRKNGSRNCDEFFVRGDLGQSAYAKLLQKSIYIDTGCRDGVRLMPNCAVIVIKNDQGSLYRFFSPDEENRLDGAENIGLISKRIVRKHKLTGGLITIPAEEIDTLEDGTISYKGCKLRFEPNCANTTYLVLEGSEASLRNVEKRLGFTRPSLGIEAKFECVEGLDIENAMP